MFLLSHYSEINYEFPNRMTGGLKTQTQDITKQTYKTTCKIGVAFREMKQKILAPEFSLGSVKRVTQVAASTAIFSTAL